MHKILILNRNESASDFLGKMLEREGFLQFVASNPETALERIRAIQPQLLIVDLPLEGISGVEMCLQLRAANLNIPTIILGESQDEMDKILLLETGADDYLVKPIGTRELLARIRAILRRTVRNPGLRIRFGDVEIDRERRIVACKGGEVKVTPCEYKLLLFFLQNADRALTRDTILNSVWGYTDYPNTRTVDTHVNKLRNKFEPDPAAPRHFLTVHGVGYRFLM
ncbi:MAG: response regulator transcription factor [Acidobacteriaceae bacterium]|nr:response regulator transcription factor [Acidobacteriaceae bacterium]